MSDSDSNGTSAAPSDEWVRRTWVRDGTYNILALWNAVDALQYADEVYRRVPRKQLADMLRLGCRLITKRASWRYTLERPRTYRSTAS